MDEPIWTGLGRLVKKVNTLTALLKVLKPYLPAKNLRLIGAVLINSTIQYVAPQSNMDKGKAHQIEAARVVNSRKGARN